MLRFKSMCSLLRIEIRGPSYHCKTYSIPFRSVCVLLCFPQCKNRTIQISILRIFFLFPTKYTDEFHLSLYHWGQQAFLLAEGSVGTYPAAIHPIRVSPHSPCQSSAIFIQLRGRTKHKFVMEKSIT
jgi:hypothetical protein